ncbi:mucin-2-like, partial [Plectropomus leopardus]|uniref:mucin-2-like n=1 Tax=Plectropomus leopardus TaxID=160734 RepID=UPI001C4AC402
TADAAPPQTVVPAPPQTVVPASPQTVVPAPPQPIVPALLQTVVPAPPQTVVPAPPLTVVPAPPQTVAPAPLQSVVPAPLQTVAPAPPQSVVPTPPQQICTVPIQLVPQTPPPSLPRPPPAPPTPPGVRSCSLTTVTPSPAAPPLRLSIPPATPAPSDRCVSSIQNLGLAPPPSRPTNQQTASSSSSLPAPSPSDHNYTFLNLHPSMKLTPESAPKKPPKALPRRRKRGRGEEQLSLTSSQEDSGVNGAGAGVSQDGKRVRTPSQKARALQEAKAEAKKKKSRTSFSPCKKRSRRSKEEVVGQNQSGLQLLPGQSMLVMTPGGLVQLAAPTTGQQLVAVAPPRNVSNCQKATPPRRRIAGHLRSIAPQPTVAVPVSLPVLNLSLPIPALPTCKPLPPAFLLQPVSNPDSSPMTSCLPQPPPKLFLPYKGTVRADPTAPPPLRREALQFDPSLMFLESPKAVRDWLSGCGGVVIPGAGVSLPYLPPFVSSLRMLSALLRAKDALTTSALQLLSQGSAPRHPPPKPRPDGTQTTTPRPDCSTQTTTPRPDCSTQTITPRPDCSTQTTTPRTGRTSQTTSSPPLDLPDSTSDLRSTQDTQAPSVSSDLLQEEEAELVAVTRQLVVERFSDNPAYQLLKARFLSCFTVPALLATLQPVREKTIAHPANEEEEEEEEEEEVINLNTSKDRAQQRRAE